MKIKFIRKKYALTALLLGFSIPTFSISAQQQDQSADVVEEVVVTGIRSSLQSALAEKRNSANLIEVIQAEDIGKLPDQNLQKC